MLDCVGWRINSVTRRAGTQVADRYIAASNSLLTVSYLQRSRCSLLLATKAHLAQVTSRRRAAVFWWPPDKCLPKRGSIPVPASTAYGCFAQLSNERWLLADSTRFTKTSSSPYSRPGGSLPSLVLPNADVWYLIFQDNIPSFSSDKSCVGGMVRLYVAALGSFPAA